MNNKELIIKFARRLERFRIGEIVALSELSEDEVLIEIDTLLTEKIIVKNNDFYFYIYPKAEPKKVGRKAQINNDNFKNIVIEELEGYEDYLKLNDVAKRFTDRRIEILKATNGLRGNTLQKFLKVYNQNNPENKYGASTIASIRKRFALYSLKGILSTFEKNTQPSIPDEIYETFKKYYLNMDKLPSEIALQLAQRELQRKNRIEYPQIYSARGLVKKVKQELGQNRIDYLRSSIQSARTMRIQNVANEPLDMMFADAAKIYLKQIKRDCKLEKLMNVKTSYKNHLSDFFDNYQLKDITVEVLQDFKQQKFNNGYSLSSTSQYLNLVRSIVKNICPTMNKFIKKSKTAPQVEMNILSISKIRKLLQLSKEKYSWGYPIIKISLLTGASIPEILALNWKEINFEKRAFYVKQFLYVDKIIKYRVNSNFRHLKFDAEIEEILSAICAKKDSANNDFVFFKENITYLQRYFEQKVLAPLAKELKIENFRPSDLIHNFVNLLLEQNVPTTYIQKACGYTSHHKFFQIYGDLIEQKEKEYYNAFQKISS